MSALADVVETRALKKSWTRVTSSGSPNLVKLRILPQALFHFPYLFPRRSLTVLTTYVTLHLLIDTRS